VKHAAPIQFLYAVNLRQVVADAGGNQQFPRAGDRPVRKRHREPPTLLARGIRSCDVFEVNGFVSRELAAADGSKVARVNAVARQVTVKCPRCGVARLTVVANQHRAAASSQDERRTQSGGAGAYDDDVVEPCQLLDAQLKHGPIRTQSIGSPRTHAPISARNFGSSRSPARSMSTRARAAVSAGSF